MTHAIRFRLAVLAALLAAPAVHAQQKVDIRRPVSPTVSVRLNGALGFIKVMGWDFDSVAISGTLVAGSRLDGGPLSVQGPLTGMKFYVEAPDEAAQRNNRLELMVPRNARVWIKAGSADILASRVTGSLDLNIIGGSVYVIGEPRELIIESMDGAVTFSGSAGYARIKTATGDIALGAGGEDVNVTTISGTVTVSPIGRVDVSQGAKSLRAGEVFGGEVSKEAAKAITRGRFESVTGAITFAGDLARGGDARFDTHSGAIELRLKPKADVDIDAITITGAIENGISPRRPIAGREGRGMELATSSGTGGASVVIRSFKGNVKLTTR